MTWTERCLDTTKNVDGYHIDEDSVMSLDNLLVCNSKGSSEVLASDTILHNGDYYTQEG